MSIVPLLKEIIIFALENKTPTKGVKYIVLFKVLSFRNRQNL